MDSLIATELGIQVLPSYMCKDCHSQELFMQSGLNSNDCFTICIIKYLFIIIVTVIIIIIMNEARNHHGTMSHIQRHFTKHLLISHY